MILPAYVLGCITALEEAGFAAWAVGGCVRDACLGLIPHDYDLCTDALPEQTEAVFSGSRLVLAGKKHGTVGVITDGGVVEITTFRTEGDYLDSRHPQWVAFVPDLRQDLARRDFTVNAMAYSPTRGFCDPFGGRADLESKTLRAVGDPQARFTEDALRILRGVRFSVRFGLTPDSATLSAMCALAPRLEALAAERVFEEMNRLLPLIGQRDLLRFAPILTRVIPELAPTVGFDQRTPHHAYDLFVHTALVVQGVGPEPALRWAALLHDVGKPQCLTLDGEGRGHFYGHAAKSSEIAGAILARLRAPTALREQAVLLIAKHMAPLEPDRKLLRRRVAQLGMGTVRQLLALQMADTDATGVSRGSRRFAGVAELLDAIQAENACLTLRELAVNGHDLMALGLAGPAIGRVQRALLEQVLEEALPNEKQPLLQAAKQLMEETL